MPSNKKSIKMQETFPSQEQVERDMSDMSRHILVVTIQRSIKKLEAENENLRQEIEYLKGKLCGPF